MKEGATTIGTATVDGSGKWTLANGSATAGAHTYTATATDAAGNGSSSTSISVTYDTVAPTVTAASASDAAVGVGGTATFMLTIDENVVITGMPTLALSNGATATYDAGSSTATSLVFKYTVQTGDSPDADVTITSVAGLTDAAGNPISYSGNPTGTTHIICFYPGTLVATPAGDVTVETLRIGDLVLTHDGATKAIRWMGRQTVSTTFADPLRVLPIRVTAGALADNMPVRDLLVSPDHALLVDGVLIQAGALVNGSTIRRERAVPTVFTYHHVELADHSLILAEGTPAETFVDNIDRMGFDNWDEHEARYGQLPAIPELNLPRAKSARQVPMATRRRLAERAALLTGQIAAA